MKKILGVLGIILSIGLLWGSLTSEKQTEFSQTSERHSEDVLDKGERLVTLVSSSEKNETLSEQSAKIGCTIAVFRNITERMFKEHSDYWHTYPSKLGRAGNPEGAPSAIDLNGDGLLDIIHTSHDRPTQIGIRTLSGGLAPSQIIVEGDNDQPDSHGHVLADLDGDGITDMLVSAGGGTGGSKFKPDHNTENFLFWGELGSDNAPVLRGGRPAARSAGLEGTQRRGRNAFVLDINGDGLLDIFSSADRRKDNILAHGSLFINQGNRTFQADDTVSEFSTTFQLTDADGDGFANEMVLVRDFCYPERKMGIDPKFPELGSYTTEAMEFCDSRIPGTIAVYKYNSKKGSVEDIGQKFSGGLLTHPDKKKKQQRCYDPNAKFGAFNRAHSCFARSIGSGDFDGDLLADHILIYASKMVLYYSSKRPASAVPFGDDWSGSEIDFPKGCTAVGLRVIDLDNDGREELFVSCEKPGEFLVYTHDLSNDFWTLKNGCNGESSLGPMNRAASLGKKTQQDAEAACRYIEQYNEQNVNKFYLNTCESITRRFKLKGFTTADLDNDGFMDVILAINEGKTLFFRNSPRGDARSNHFLVFTLKGKDIGNAKGIGATLILYARNMCKGCGESTQLREVTSHAVEHHGHKDERLFFGLGQRGQPTKVVVRWPNGEVQTVDLSEWNFSSTVNPVIIEQE